MSWSFFHLRKDSLASISHLSCGRSDSVSSSIYSPRASGDHRVNVTSQLRAAVKDGKLHIYAGNQIDGDPTPNTPKELIVTYTTEKGGFVLGKVVPEGQTLDLP